MRYPGIEGITCLDEFITNDTALYAFLDLFESEITGLDLVSGQLAQRSFLSVVLHFNHHILHSLHVADQNHQVLRK